MEEVPIVKLEDISEEVSFRDLPPQEIEPTPYYMNLTKDTFPKLLNIIQSNYDSVNIRTFDGKVVGTLPEPYCLIFEYYSTMKFSGFVEAKSNTKVMTMPPDFTEEECQFFVDIIPKLFMNTIELSGKQIVWLFKFFGVLLVNSDFGKICLQNVPMYNEHKLALLNYAVSECSGKNPGIYLTEILKLASENIDLHISDLAASLLSYPLGRNVIVKLLKDDNCKCGDETQLFIDLVNKIYELNKKTPEHQISLKAFLDIMACIRWFYVDEREVTKLLDKIKSQYPDFNMTNSMTLGFSRRKQLVQKYSGRLKGKQKGTFKYTEKFNSLDARSWYGYVQEVNFSGYGPVTIYSTTEYPIPIKLSLSTLTKKKLGKHFYIINSSVPELFIFFTLKDPDTKHEIINQKWTFKNGKRLYIEAHNKYKTKFIMTILMAYIPN